MLLFTPGIYIYSTHKPIISNIALKGHLLSTTNLVVFGSI